MLNKELDLISIASSGVINNLLDILEKNWDGYSSSDEVMEANDLLKWINGECTDKDAHVICQNITGYDF